MEIIKLEVKHLKAALDLVWDVFQEFEAPDYSNQGVEEFHKFISYDSILESFNENKLFFYGCIDNSELTGVIATRGYSHICLLFVRKDYHRRGIARNLFLTVAAVCKKNRLDKITVNSSPFAIEVYHHLGFVDTDIEQTVNGIRFTPMSYLIQ